MTSIAVTDTPQLRGRDRTGEARVSVGGTRRRPVVQGAVRQPQFDGAAQQRPGSTVRAAAQQNPILAVQHHRDRRRQPHPGRRTRRINGSHRWRSKSLNP